MSRGTQVPSAPLSISITGLSPSMARFSNLFRLSNHGSRDDGPTTPYAPKGIRFGLVPVRSPLLRKSLLFSFPGVTKMFQFTPFASTAYGFS